MGSSSLPAVETSIKSLMFDIRVLESSSPRRVTTHFLLVELVWKFSESYHRDLSIGGSFAEFKSSENLANVQKIAFDKKQF